MFGMSVSPFLLRAATVIASLPRDKSFISFDGIFGNGRRENWIEVVKFRPWFGADGRRVIPSSDRISIGVEKRVALLMEDFNRAFGRPPDFSSDHHATAVLLTPDSMVIMSDVYLIGAIAYDDLHAGAVYSFRISWREAIYEPR